MQLVRAVEADVPRLIDILFAAFANDGLIVGTCYPDTPANRQWWVRSMTAQMASGKTVVYKVVTDGDDGIIMAWAKWLIQRSSTDGMKAEGAVNPSNEPSPDMNMEACQKLAQGQYTMRENVMQGRDHYWLNALATDPLYQRQGAATALVAQGAKMADDEGLETFSACTTQANANMKSVFQRAGFSIVAQEPVANSLSVHAGLRAPGTSAGAVS